jgi:hypothetical protein
MTIVKCLELFPYMKRIRISCLLLLGNNLRVKIVIVGCDTIYFVRHLRTFRINVSPPSSGQKSECGGVTFSEMSRNLHQIMRRASQKILIFVWITAKEVIHAGGWTCLVRCGEVLAIGGSIELLLVRATEFYSYTHTENIKHF